MKTMKKLMGTIPLLFAISLTACDKTAENTEVSTTEQATEQSTEQAIEQATEQATEKATYTVAMNTDYAPFEFMGEDGTLIGFDIDMLDAIAEKENFNVTYTPYKFTQIIPAVQAGEQDMSASSIFISEERKQLINYSASYFTLPVYIVGIEKENRPQQITDIFDKTISIEGSNFLTDKIAQETFGKNNEIIKEKTNYLAYENMYTGKVDLMLENIVTVKDHSQHNNDKPLFYLPLPEENSIRVAYITQKGNTELMNKLNSGLAKIKADGTYDEIYTKWFGNLTQFIKNDTQK